MNFLHPLFLFGVAAVAAPVWLHLRRKPEKDVLHFSALRFLDDEPVPRASPHHLRDLLMFALRALAVALVVLAFAWPYLKGAPPLEVSSSRVYVLDNTLSNQAGDAFIHARDEILKSIGKADGNTQIAVVELTYQPRTVVNFGDSHPQAESTLRALKPSYQRGSFLAAFNQANALLSQSLGLKKEIIIYSDNQESQWAENVNSPPFLKNVDVKVAQPPELKERPNLALQQPMAARFFVGDKAIINFNVLLRHTGAAKNAMVTLRVNHQEIFHRDVDLASQAGDMRLVTQWESDPSLWIEGEAEIAGNPDDLPGDNRTFFALPPMKEGRVVLLSQSTYLRAALAPEVMRGHWSQRILQPTKLAEEITAPLNDDVLVVEAGYLQSKDARDLVFKYLNNGRGVVLLLNRVTPLVRGVLSSLDFDLLKGGDEGDAAAAAPPQFIRYIAMQHPVFASFTEADFGDLSGIKITRHCHVTSKSAAPLIFSDTGDALLFEALKTKGRLIVSTFGFERSQTDWPVQISFVPFLDSLLHYARGLKEMQTTFEPGEIYAMEIPQGDASPREVVLRKDSKPVLNAAVDANRRAQIPIPGEPGIYSITYDASPAVQTMIAVNPPAKESELNYTADPAAIKAWQLPDTGKRPPTAATTEIVSHASALQQRLWWFLLCGGAAALALEMIWLLLRKAQA